MTISIIRYRKITDQFTTYELRRPDGLEDGDFLGVQEVATLEDGFTYVCLPENIELPSQPEEILIEPVKLTEELRKALQAASPQCQEIDRLQRKKIRDAYPLEEELKFARFAGGTALGVYSPTPEELAELAAYQQLVESVRSWGREERAKLGLFSKELP